MIQLNEEQKKAIFHNEGPILVIAGAGTGKTRVITERIAHILENKWCESSDILALTFTEKSAGEMEARLDERMPIGEIIQVSTFHSFCEKILRQYGIDIGLSPGFKIIEGVAQWKLIKDHLFNFDLKYYRPTGNPNKFIDAMIAFFGRLKDELIDVEQFKGFSEKKISLALIKEERLDSERLLELSNAFAYYQDLMAKNDYLDFSDLQFKLINLLEKRPNILAYLQNQYRYILVDEYQDTNIAQNHIVDLLAKKHKNLMVVGDDDQSIYKFRGAAISNILQFEDKYPDLKKVVLTQNYRSNQKILAYTSIKNNNPNRLEIKSNINKKLIAQIEGNDDAIELVHCSTINQEVDYLVDKIKNSDCSLSKIAILLRANSYAKPFVEALRTENIPYQFLSEKGLYNKDEVKELISLFRVLTNPKDEISFFRVLRMDFWEITMMDIVDLISLSKKEHHGLWYVISHDERTKKIKDYLIDLIEYSKNHSACEVLFRFTEKTTLYQKLLAQNNIESEEKITNIASYFDRVHRFERESEEKTVKDFIEYLDLAMEAGENPSAHFDVGGIDGVQISTIHGVKGLEFDMVFLPSLVSRRFPSDNRKNSIEIPSDLISEVLNEGDFHLQEERRLFYVALTRAKKHLCLLYSDFYSASNSKNPRAKKMSVFLQEIIEDIPVKIKKTTEGVERFIKPISNHMPLSSKLENRQPILKFSYSALKSFKDCPRKYEYNYILKIPQSPTGASSFGSSLHNTLNEFYKLVNQSKQAVLFEDYQEDLSLNKLLSIYEDKWISVGYESREHHDSLKKRGKEILENFYKHFKKELTDVEFLEKGFKLKLGKYIITGRIDRADKLPDGSLEIIDYKSGKSKKQKEVDKDQQLMIYAMAVKDCFNLSASKLTLYFLDEDIKLSTESSPEKLDKLKSDIIETADEINVSDFKPKPSKFLCQFCPYKKICDKADL